MSSKEVWYDWMGANTYLFQQINSLSGQSKWYDLLMLNITKLGDKHLIPYYVAILVAWVAVSIIMRKLSGKAGIKQYATSWVGVFIVMGAALVLNLASTIYLKDHFAFSRPYIALPQEGKAMVQLEFREAEDNLRSFPSGHTSRATIIIASLWPLLFGWRCWLGALAVFGVAWSRIALGVHFPADVVLSILICVLQVAIVRALIYGTMRRILHIKC
jgi:membrane-associated phospholipid phosphatase